MIAPVPVAPAVPAPAAPVFTTPAADTPVPRQSLIARPHTVLGVCEGIGEDLGFNPLWLRIAFASGIFFAPLAVVGAYLALGLVVAGSRWAFPVVAAAPSAAPVVASVEAQANEEYRIAA